MKIRNVIAAIAVILTMASCGVVEKTNPYSVGRTSLEYKMSDFEFIGESEITCQYDTYLGVIKRLNTINGKLFNPGNKVSLDIKCNNSLLASDKYMGYAAAELLKKYPNAHYFQVVSVKTQKDKMFLGSSVKQTAKVRVYKFAKTK